MSWNVQFFEGTDAVTNQDRTASWIASINPDIIGLCEATAGNVSNMANLLTQKTGRTWFAHFIPKYNGTDEGNLILSWHPFASTDGRFMSANRSVAQVTINVGGRNVNFFATHLDDAASSNRVVEVGELKSFMSNFSEPRIVVGDFNGGPDTAEAIAMTDTYLDSWMQAMNRGTASAYPDNPVGTQTRTRRGRIDYIFTSNQNSGLVLNSARIPDSRDLNNTNVVLRLGTLDDKGVRPSDHNFVVGDFDLSADSVPTPTPTPTPTPAPATPPFLLTDILTNRAVALHSDLFTRDPFKVVSPLNFSSDQRTRVILFALNVNLLSGETPSAITARAVSSSGAVYDLAVENVTKIGGFDWLSGVVVMLPQDSSLSGNITVTITLHGATSNSVTIAIAPP